MDFAVLFIAIDFPFEICAFAMFVAVVNDSWSLPPLHLRKTMSGNIGMENAIKFYKYDIMRVKRMRILTTNKHISETRAEIV